MKILGVAEIGAKLFSRLGNSLKTVAGELNLNGLSLKSLMASDNLHITVNSNDPVNPYKDATFADSGLHNFGTPSYTEIKAKFEAAIADNPDVNRVSFTSGGTDWSFFRKDAGNEWSFTSPWLHGAVSLVSEGYGTVENDATNPLFVEENGTPISPMALINNYNLKPLILMRLVVGAKATMRFVVPSRTRSAELLTDIRTCTYAQGSFLATMTYSDGTIVTARARSYNYSWYFGEIIDQSKALVSLSIEVDAETLTDTGLYPSAFSRNFATGVEFHYTDTANYPTGTPVIGILYWTAYQNLTVVAKRFHSPEADATDITSSCTVTASVAANTAFPVTNMTDNNPTTCFKPAANSNALTITALHNLPNYVFRHVDITLKLDSAAPTVLESTSRIAVTTQRNLANSTVTGNTADFLKIDVTKVDSDGNITIRMFAGVPNTYPLSSNKLTVALTKTVTGVFSVTAVKVYGHTML